MKILSIMCDMLRPDVLRLDHCEGSNFENMLKTTGGTFYTNCYSQGPDTGRSMGCYWSGKIPQDNGCDRRIKYPKFYMKDNSFLDVLSAEDFHFYFFSNPNEKVLGILPPGYEDIGIHNSNLNFKEFIKKIDMSEPNLYVHIDLTDFHWALDDFGANALGVEKGLSVLYQSISTLFDIINPNEFDYVFIFSDHGFKYECEFNKEEKYLLLNRARSNTLMFIHQKGDKGFAINDKLCSLIDVYPTIMEIIEKEYQGYGHSLFSLDEPEFIIAEEHGKFLPAINQEIEYWAVIKKDVIYFRSKDGYYRNDGNNFELNKKVFDSFLASHSRSFEAYYKQSKILELYKTMATDKSFYTNGEKRYTVGKYDFLKKIKYYLNKNSAREV